MSNTWLVDADNPLLTEPFLARVTDPAQPDRLAWNTFRTLALWETDVWVPRLVGIACGEGSPLSAVEWSGAAVLPWAAGLAADGLSDVLVEGPEAVIVVGATLAADLGAVDVAAYLTELAEATGSRDYGFVAVLAPGATGPGWPERSGGEVADDGRTGWLTWAELGTVALDLAEEGDELRGEQVHRLVDELQQQFPGIEL